MGRRTADHSGSEQSRGRTSVAPLFGLLGPLGRVELVGELDKGLRGSPPDQATRLRKDEAEVFGLEPPRDSLP